MVDAADENTLLVTLPVPSSPPTEASAIPHYSIHVLATTAGGWQHEYDVSRRFSEFQALAMDFEELTGMATPYPLPAPPRLGTFTRSDENLPEGQRRELELFIQTLLSFITPFPAGHPVKKLVISDFLHFDHPTSAADSKPCMATLRLQLLQLHHTQSRRRLGATLLGGHRRSKDLKQALSVLFSAYSLTPSAFCD
ncbi:hypothetical protein FOZ63_005534 [Perkinsus olseni]|uniref:PX domain-containing protein n=1 Tax=Perkinsus olseni TaxID=32597 RepID=A0A7J6TG02_PEROL|nr:hypothetical protein FOZ63_005534 [Perkinsus olseni]